MSFEVDEYGNTELINAILEEDTDLVIELLDTLSEEELRVNHVNYIDHRDALQLACEKGMAAVALRLIDAGADTNYVGGQGHKAIDYAVAFMKTAKDLSIKNESQLQYAAEDEQWDLLCEYREEQKRHATSAEEMREVVEVLESRLPGSDTEDVEEAKEQVRQRAMQYLRAGRANPRIKWDTSTDVPGTMFFLHLMRTYRESMCYVNTKVEAGLMIWFDLEKQLVRLGLEPILPYASSKEDPNHLLDKNAIKKSNNAVLESIVGQIAKCLRNGVTQIIIPVALDDANDATVRHMNILVFRTRDWSLEHYEPHGKTNLVEHWSTEKGRQKNAFLHQMISGVFERLSVVLDRRLKKWKSNQDKPALKLLTSSETCPSHRGFQSLQTRNSEFEQGGVCSVWALFVAEMSAAHPALSVRQIQNTIYSKLAEYDISLAGDFLLNMLKGFVARILETTRFYAPFFDVREDEDWNFENIHRKNPLKKLKWLCWFESQSAYDAGYAAKRLSSKDVGKEEAKYAAKYVALGAPAKPMSKRRTRKNRKK